MSASACTCSMRGLELLNIGYLNEPVPSTPAMKFPVGRIQDLLMGLGDTHGSVLETRNRRGRGSLERTEGMLPRERKNVV